MSGSTNLKILTTGSAMGAITELLAKVKGIDAKHGKFDLVLCVGDFFGRLTGESDEAADLLDGKLEVPVECYIMQGDLPLPQPVIDKFAKTGGELCKNVFLLSKSGIVKTPNGLRIACLGGGYDPLLYATADGAPGFSSSYFSTHTVEKLITNASGGSQSKNYTSLSAIRASADSDLIDILLTNTWPSSIHEFSSLPSSDASVASAGAPPIDSLVRRVKPRYHFAPGAGQPRRFWEREPYVWDDEHGRVSRFVTLGSFGDPAPEGGKKQRWFYAFSISPMDKAAQNQRPSNATKNPFTESIARPEKRRRLDAGDGSGENFIWGNQPQQQLPGKRAKSGGQDKPPDGYQCKICQSAEHFINDCPDRSKPPEGYICKICNEPGHFVRDCPTKHAPGDTGGRKPRPGYVCRACGSEEHYLDDCPVAKQTGRRQGGDRKKAPPKEISPDECWFCLSNPNLSKYLVVAVGTECYVTLPKGQIIPTHSDDASPPLVPGGGHVLIVPIAHYPTLASLPPDIARPTLEELERYKSALRGLYAKYGAAAVFFEVGRLSAKGGHAHVQCVPVPLDLKDQVEDNFVNIGRQQGIEFESDADGALEACAADNRSYFRVDLPDGRKLVHLLQDHGRARFNLQFGREVLTAALGMRDRLDWKACALSEEQDKADADAFKAAFGPFDQTMTLF